MRRLVTYFSRTGSNRFLAEKTAEALEADTERIKPLISLYPCLLLGTWMGFGMGIRKPKSSLQDYDAVVVIAPIFLGKLALPAQTFVRNYSNRMKKIYFATCCGSTNEKRSDKFGYESAFRHIRKLAGEKCVHCEAFPLAMVIPEEKQDDPEAFMNTKLSNYNFNGAILEKFNSFIKGILAG